jgi:hypothetical protein
VSSVQVHSVLEDDSELGNYAIGESFFTHEYADSAATYIAYFASHRQGATTLKNNARGIFRVEASVSFVARNKSPVIRMMPVRSHALWCTAPRYSWRLSRTLDGRRWLHRAADRAARAPL